MLRHWTAKNKLRQAVDVLISSENTFGFGGKAATAWDCALARRLRPASRSARSGSRSSAGSVISGATSFSFVMRIEGVGFREAWKCSPIKLESRSRSSAPAVSAGPALRPDRRILKSRANGLSTAMAWVEKQYHECLLDSPDAEPARATSPSGDQPRKRAGIPSRLLARSARWLLGLAGGSRRAGRSGNRRLGSIRGRAGLLRSISRPRAVLDPRHARSTGWHRWRILPESGLAPAKYINSPETPCSQGKLLYGLDVARGAIRKSRTALVMEGYTDCIVAHQSGFDNAVACWERHWGRAVQILKRFADRIVLVLDGDRAGQKRSGRSPQAVHRRERRLAILLPDDADPANSCSNTRRCRPATQASTRYNTRFVRPRLSIWTATSRDQQALQRMVGILAKVPVLRSTSRGKHGHEGCSNGGAGLRVRRRVRRA